MEETRLPRTVAERAPRLAELLTVVGADALAVSAADLGEPSPTALVANLPYNVSVPVVLNFLEHFPSLQRVLVMVQLEVAERICAAPDTDAYGRLAVLSQWRCRCELLMRLPPGAFSPPKRRQAFAALDLGTVRGADDALRRGHDVQPQLLRQPPGRGVALRGGGGMGAACCSAGSGASGSAGGIGSMGGAVISAPSRSGRPSG